jgi:hypothetical protein
MATLLRLSRTSSPGGGGGRGPAPNISPRPRPPPPPPPHRWQCVAKPPSPSVSACARRLQFPLPRNFWRLCQKLQVPGGNGRVRVPGSLRCARQEKACARKLQVLVAGNCGSLLLGNFRWLFEEIAGSCAVQLYIEVPRNCWGLCQEVSGVCALKLHVAVSRNFRYLAQETTRTSTPEVRDFTYERKVQIFGKST